MKSDSNWKRILRRAWNAIPPEWRTSRAGRVLRAGYRAAQAIGDHPRYPGNGSRISIPHLEIHITHKCNLTCESCLHFTNHRHAGTISPDDLRKSMSLWSNRLLPRRFAILGGEPCMHRELVDIVHMTGEMWPHPRTARELVTNGLLLHLHPGLPQALADTDTSLCISIHSDGSVSPKYQEKFSRGLALARTWQRDYGIDVVLDDSFNEWTRGYRGFGDESTPFEDNDPQASWDHCVTGQECFQLFEDHLWKCAPLAYLRLQDRKFDLSEKWKPYLQYRPLGPDCSNAQIVEFFRRRSEPVCGMCPSNPQNFVKPDPLLPVKFHKTRARRPGPVEELPHLLV